MRRAAHPMASLLSLHFVFFLVPLARALEVGSHLALVSVPPLLACLWLSLPLLAPTGHEVGGCGDEWCPASHYPDLQSTRCTIPRVSLQNITNEDFIQTYWRRPVILVDSSGRNDVLRAHLQKAVLLREYGNTTVVLSSANSFSYGTRRMRFHDYVLHQMAPWDARTPQRANETFYFFGYNDWDEWNALARLYEAVPLADAAGKQSLSFGLGGAGSGVPFHTHGPVFAELFYGEKRWFLYPPSRRAAHPAGNPTLDPHSPDTPHSPPGGTASIPPFDPDLTSLHWLRHEYPALPVHQLPVECTCVPGEVLWIPDDWHHSTLNIGEAVFISAFI